MYEYNLQTWPSSKNPIIQLYIHETPLDKKINYTDKDYISLARQIHSFSEENLEERARENLRALGEAYE